MADSNPLPFQFPAGMDLSSLLSGSSGPVNWEIATFLPRSMAGDAEERPRWTEVEGEYDELVRAAEVEVAAYTGLSSSHLLTPVEVVSRARWAELNVRAFAPVVEPLAKKVAESQSAAGAMPAGAEPFANLMKALTPFMLGAQTGMLAGYLSHQVLGSHDLMVPPEPGKPLMFVARNLEAAERELNVVPRDFKYWIALREVIRAYEYNQPGVREALIDMLARLAAAVQVDPDKLGAGLENLDPTDFEGMQAALGDPSQLFSHVSSPAELELAAELEAFVGFVEGYADHVLHACGSSRIPSVAEIERAIEQRDAERGDVEDSFQEAFGIGMRRGGQTAGRSFVDHIAAVEDIAVLARIFAEPSARPDLDELSNPEAWLARTVGRRG